ncbi:hypothetical protein GCK72_000291 [Caenorhabditis remanei]|uniref:Uncharacterized protein n=1 Tax=Caenorhabditis remanei TaxID=31234 RepID=A0A6A5HLQ0_CAERE|nr:hypothetical protein GCK72_000291 [Caenorhabditis remanei]KAF1768479.1 hypothetical protein GCK72_000291 [Caenorhabditis remanei]
MADIIEMVEVTGEAGMLGRPAFIEQHTREMKVELMDEEEEQRIPVINLEDDDEEVDLDALIADWERRERRNPFFNFEVDLEAVAHGAGGLAAMLARRDEEVRIVREIRYIRAANRGIVEEREDEEAGGDDDHGGVPEPRPPIAAIRPPALNDNVYVNIPPPMGLQELLFGPHVEANEAPIDEIEDDVDSGEDSGDDGSDVDEEDESMVVHVESESEKDSEDDDDEEEEEEDEGEAGNVGDRVEGGDYKYFFPPRLPSFQFPVADFRKESETEKDSEDDDDEEEDSDGEAGNVGDRGEGGGYEYFIPPRLPSFQFPVAVSGEESDVDEEDEAMEEDSDAEVDVDSEAEAERDDEGENVEESGGDDDREAESDPENSMMIIDAEGYYGHDDSDADAESVNGGEGGECDGNNEEMRIDDENRIRLPSFRYPRFVLPDSEVLANGEDAGNDVDDSDVSTVVLAESESGEDSEDDDVMVIDQDDSDIEIIEAEDDDDIMIVDEIPPRPRPVLNIPYGRVQQHRPRPPVIDLEDFEDEDEEEIVVIRG